jgi:acyl-coenzyme A synthetase/AMP-(fatty) acid ligase
MHLFCIDDKEYLYSDIINDINKSRSYIRYHKTNILYERLLNIIIAIVSNKPITLIDADHPESGLGDISGNVNKHTALNKINLKYNNFAKCILNSKSDIALFTSGTTGQPKDIVHSIASLTRNVRLSERYVNNVWGFAYNPAHMAGVQVFLQAILNRNTIVNIFNRTPNEVSDLIEKYSVTNISATPTYYKMQFDPEKQHQKVNRVTFGGEKLDNTTLRKIANVFPRAKINNVYASTEVGALFASSGENFRIPEMYQRKIHIFDNELLVHKTLMGSSSDIITHNDFYNTGDMVEWVDKSSCTFRFTSRKNELLNIGGYNINPHEVEGQIVKLPGISDAQVYSKPNSVLGNILCADIIKEDNSEISVNDIKKFLFNTLQDYKVPRIFKYVDTISLTRTGKRKRS